MPSPVVLGYSLARFQIRIRPGMARLGL